MLTYFRKISKIKVLQSLKVESQQSRGVTEELEVQSGYVGSPLLCVSLSFPSNLKSFLGLCFSSANQMKPYLNCCIILVPSMFPYMFLPTALQVWNTWSDAHSVCAQRHIGQCIINLVYLGIINLLSAFGVGARLRVCCAT